MSIYNIWEVTSIIDINNIINNNKIIILALSYNNSIHEQKILKSFLKNKNKLYPHIMFIFYNLKKKDIKKNKIFDKNKTLYPMVFFIYNKKLIITISNIDHISFDNIFKHYYINTDDINNNLNNDVNNNNNDNDINNNNNNDNDINNNNDDNDKDNNNDDENGKDNKSDDKNDDISDNKSDDKNDNKSDDKSDNKNEQKILEQKILFDKINIMYTYNDNNKINFLNDIKERKIEENKKNNIKVLNKIN